MITILKSREGMSGMLFGAFAGTVRSSTPVLFALASGFQWFTLGTAFWGMFNMARDPLSTVFDKIQPQGGVSSTPGARIKSPRGRRFRPAQLLEELEAQPVVCYVSCSLFPHFRSKLCTGGRGNIIPGAVMFALFGAAGQALFNKVDAQKSEAAERKADLKDSWLNSKWSPVKVLSDKEYENILREKLLKVDVEISLLEENIEALRAQERQMAAREAPANPGSSIPR